MVNSDSIWNDLEQIVLKQGRLRVHYDINYETAVKKRQYMFWLDQGRHEVGRRNPGIFENKDGDCRILTLFETILWKVREHFENKDA